MSSRKKKTSTPPLPPPPPAAPDRGLARPLILTLTAALHLAFTIFAIHKATRPKSPTSLAATAPAAQPPPPTDDQVYATYAGSASCRECHQKEYDLWAQSHHGLAERAPDPKLDQQAFNPERTFPHGTQKTTVREKNGKYEIETTGYDGKSSAYPVDRVIGHNPLRQFLTPAPGNRLQALEASYDPRNNQWFNVYGGEDRKVGEWGHWTGRGMNWNSQCAACHNTRLRKNYDEKTDAYHTRMSELTVSCESCHGPMKDHVTAYKNGAPPPPATTKPSTTSPAYKLAQTQMLDTCGSCHARRAELTGDFVPRDAFHDHHALSIPDLSDLFYPDGQVRDEDYEFTAFLGSKMHAAGVTCTDCHEPHSAKTLYPGNALCMRCHNGSYPNSPLILPEFHSKHAPDSPGNQCVSCHMPVTTYMQRHGRHDHGFTIPDPLLTKQHNIPNACNRCHTDKDVDWSLAAVDKWYGPKMKRPSRDRAQWIARARAGDDAARAPLVRLLNEEKQPFWRAVAAAVLSPWAAAPDVLGPLVAATEHADPLVRENAARALEPVAQQQEPTSRAALARLLADPSRNVRVRAAWALRDTLDATSTAAKDLQTYLAHNADQPGGAMQQGVYHLSRNDLGAAIGYFKKAITWDPNSAPFHDSLAVALSMNGQTPLAIEHLLKAAALDPREAEYPYKLALAYAEAGQVDKTITYLQQTLKLNPRHGRAAYNLGLAYHSSNQPDAAIAALRQAESLSPNDPEIPYALATIHLARRENDQARDAAIRALTINRQYQPAIQLLRQLGPP